MHRFILCRRRRGGAVGETGNQIQQNIELIHIFCCSVDVGEPLLAVKRILPRVPAPPSWVLVSDQDQLFTAFITLMNRFVPHSPQISSDEDMGFGGPGTL